MQTLDELARLRLAEHRGDVDRRLAERAMELAARSAHATPRAMPSPGAMAPAGGVALAGGVAPTEGVATAATRPATVTSGRAGCGPCPEGRHASHPA